MISPEQFRKELTECLSRRKNENVTRINNDYFQAAVLVPLVLSDGKLSLLFEVRSSQLAWQPGEICFPGGHIEQSDDGPAAAAVRETLEELGLAPSKINVLGALDVYIGPIGVMLYPFVGYLTDIKAVSPNSGEVAEIFTVPLDYLLAIQPQIAHMEMGTRPLADFPFKLVPGYHAGWKRRSTYQVFFYQYGPYVIWGLTAQVLYNFLTFCQEFKKV